MKLFFDEMRHELARFKGGRVPLFDERYASKRGFLAANKKWFKEIGIDFEASGADLAIVEEVVLTRNLAQHPESIGSMNLTFRGKQVKRPPFPWFVHEFERHGVDPENLEDLERFSWPEHHAREVPAGCRRGRQALREYIWWQVRGEDG